MAKNKSSSIQARPVPASPLISGMIAGAVPDRSDGMPVPFLRMSGAEASGRWGIDVSKAPVPQRRYAAELCSIKVDTVEARLIFAQRCLLGDTLDSALVIRMSFRALREFAESMHDMSIGTMQAELNLPEESLSEISSRPQQMANVVSNLVSVGVADHETCLDFYHASPFAISKVGKVHNQNKLEVEPVVRVDIRTSLFVPLVRKLNELVAGLSA